VAPMIAALLQTDEETSRRWLSFPSIPPEGVRRALVGAGWPYHGGHRAWHHDDPNGVVPPGFALGRGGSCRYSIPAAPRSSGSSRARLRPGVSRTASKPARRAPRAGAGRRATRAPSRRASRASRRRGRTRPRRREPGAGSPAPCRPPRTPRHEEERIGRTARALRPARSLAPLAHRGRRGARYKMPQGMARSRRARHGVDGNGTSPRPPGASVAVTGCTHTNHH
jgi:hypothetical protein